MSRAIIITLIVIAVIIGGVCVYIFLNPSHANDPTKFDRTYTAAETERIETVTVTAEELQSANGKDGHPAYIAIQGVVYDVSSFEGWAGGIHHKLLAGQDLTDQFLKSGHGVEYLQKLPVVGSLETAAAQ